MKKTKKILLCLILFIAIVAIRTQVNATEIIVSPSKPKVGDKITITVKVPNVHTVDVTANVSGVASGTIRLVGGDLTGKAKTYTKSASYQCKKEGNININISNGSTAVLSGEYVKVDASKTVKVSKKAQSTSNTTDSTTINNALQTDATLKNLGFTPVDFKGFKKGVTSYSVSVPKSTEKISIYATPTNPKATVSGTGSKTLQIGKNTFSVKVVAEDKKTTKTYTLIITRKKEDENASDATLTNLGIRPKEYDFTGFRTGTTTYSASVPNDVEKITIYGTAKSDKATISGIGSKSLKVGLNKCEVKVTSQDKKTTKTYIINVTRKEEANEEDEDKKDEKEIEELRVGSNSEDINKVTTEGLKNIEVKDYTLTPAFSQDVYSYTVDVSEGLLKLDIDAETTSDDIEVEIAGNENLQKGENIITLIVNNKKDNSTETYQINANVGNQNTSNEVEKKNSPIKREWIIMGIIFAVVALLVFFLVKNFRHRDEYEDDEEYEDEDVLEDESIDESEDNYKEDSTSDDLRKIGLFDENQKIEFNDPDDEPKNHGKYKGRRFK